MKKGLKALAVITAAALALAGTQAFAVCNDPLTGFPIFQLAEADYFNPPPAGSGAVTAKLFQIGFGNDTINTAVGTTGTGMDNLSTFAGNDSGLWHVDLVDASVIINDPRVPAGALALGNNNWSNAGFDGCVDNPRDPTQPFNDDNILNPEYNVYYYRAFGYRYASTAWVQDYPIAALLTEATGNSFAIAAVASNPRSGVNDILPGEYNFKWVNNGLLNPINNDNTVIPWQRVPGDPVAGDPNTGFATVTGFVNPADSSSDRFVDLHWTDAVIYSDQSVRPSTQQTVTAGGVGINDMGDLVRYVVEEQTVPDGSADPYGQIVEANWTAVQTLPQGTSSVTGLQVPVNTCIRLHTLFGKTPQTSTYNPMNCRIGKCGDLGYAVASPPACIGGPLVADGVPKNLSAMRGKGHVDVTWSTDIELTVSRFDVGVVDKSGNVRNVSSVSCKQCGNGNGDKYTVSLNMSDLKGGRTIQVTAVGPNASKQTNIK